MNDKELDRLFRERLENFSVSPRNDMWRQIEKELDEKKTARIHRFRWVSYAALSIGCLGVAALLYLSSDQESANQQQRLAKLQKEETPTTVAKESIEGESVASSSRPETAKPALSPIINAKKEISNPLVRHNRDDRNLLAVVRDQPNVIVEHPMVSSKSSRNEVSTQTLVRLQTANVSPAAADNFNTGKEVSQYAIEVPPIQPLIDDPEAEQTMLASANPNNEGWVPSILNKISEALNPSENTSVQFSKDEEGSLRLDIFNSLVKNRNKKRR